MRRFKRSIHIDGDARGPGDGLCIYRLDDLQLNLKVAEYQAGRFMRDVWVSLETRITWDARRAPES